MKPPLITSEQVLPLWVTTLKALGLTLRTPYPPERGGDAQFYVGVTLLDYFGACRANAVASALGYPPLGAASARTDRTRWRRANTPDPAILDACALAFETGKVVEIAPKPSAPAPEPTPDPIIPAPIPPMEIAAPAAPEPPAAPAPLPVASTPPSPPARTMTDIAKSVASTFPKAVRPVQRPVPPPEPKYPDVPRGRAARPPQHPPITTVARSKPVPELKADGSNMYDVPLLRSGLRKPQPGVSVPMPGDKPDDWTPPPVPVDEPRHDGETVVNVQKFGSLGQDLNRVQGRNKVTLPRLRFLDGGTNG